MEKLEDAEELKLPEKKPDDNISPEGISSIQGNPEEKPPENPVEKPQIPEDQFLKVDKVEKEPINTEQNPQEFTYPQDDQGIHEVGNSEELAKYWKLQEGRKDCGIYAQAGVLEANGKAKGIDDLRQQAVLDGSFTSKRGMNPSRLGDLLEANGVEVTKYEVASFQDMERELQMGNGVITAVGTDPLWGGRDGDGHALWITGMELDKNGNPINIISNDSGRPDGKAIKYPYEDFKQAWLQYHNQMIATKNPLNMLK